MATAALVYAFEATMGISPYFLKEYDFFAGNIVAILYLLKCQSVAD